MTSPRRWICLALLLAAVTAGTPALAAPAAAKRPNVVLFLVDDMGWVDCGAYGSTYYQTPRIDAFAQTAMRFTNAYAHPLCSPTRASILTGWYPARHGILSATGHKPPQPPGHVFMPEQAPPNQPVIMPESKNYLAPAIATLPATLRAHGYRTAHIGKWHLGLTPKYWPDKHGFDVSFHCAPDPGPPGDYFSPYRVMTNGPPRGGRPVGTITDGPAGEYIVDRQAAEAVKFIQAAGDAPFYLQLWCYGVHGPWGHKPEYTAEFATRTDPQGRQRNPIMASMLRSVDECFGRILDELAARGLLDDTIVIFYSDNGGNVHSNAAGAKKTKALEKRDPLRLADWKKWAGDAPPTSNQPLREGKGRLYEGGIRVPLMWAWAGRIPAGGTSDVVAGHVDLFPTVLDLVGLPAPEGHVFDGVSLAPVLTGTSDTIDREAFVTYFPGPNVGGATVRRGDWKLIRWFDPAQPRELYHLGDDIGESRNLAASRPEIVSQLDALIDRHFADTGALVPRPNPAFKPAAAAAAVERPNVVLLMADDHGWGETGYNGHPHVQTPVLDDMARTGLRLDRFYAGSAVCSPTRASVMTGRHANRSGVLAFNFSTRPEEITLPHILQQAGYRTGHFGKWHLGAVKQESPVNPNRMGFDESLSHDNYFDVDPALSRNGAAPQILKGESSEVLVDEALAFIRRAHRDEKPFFVVIWFGSPHGPFVGLPKDVALYDDVPDPKMRQRFAEITAMDRSIGTLRAGLRTLGVADHTLVWFNSDNGIPPKIDSFNGRWRGFKGGIDEGSFLGPGLIEWPAVITTPRVSAVPCVTSDILPTVLDLAGVPYPDPGRPLDGISLRKLIVDGTMTARPSPIGFWKYDQRGVATHPRWIPEKLARGDTPGWKEGIDFQNFHHPVPKTADFGGRAAWTDNRYKLITAAANQNDGEKTERIRLYDLQNDPEEATNIAKENPEIVDTMMTQLHAWQASIERSLSGADYAKAKDAEERSASTD